MVTTAEFDEVINHVGIPADKILCQDFMVGRMVFVGEKAGRSVLVKMVDKRQRDIVENYQSEYENDRFIEAEISRLGVRTIERARVVERGENQQFVWVIRNYIPGNSLASFDQTNRSLYGYDIIQPLYINAQARIVPQVGENLQRLRAMPYTEPIATHRRFFLELEAYPVEQLRKIVRGDSAQSLQFFQDISVEYYHVDKLSACHGDFVPGNILVGNDMSVTLSDFEWFGYDNNTFDLAFFWLFLWRYPEWQKILLKHCPLAAEEYPHFCASVIRIILGWYKPVCERDTIDYSERAQEYYHHKWLEYLVAAGKSFEELTKI